jgi:hypothetical protein
MKSRVLDILLRILFLPFPKMVIREEEEMLFNKLFESALMTQDRTIQYNLSIPKYKFLQYLSDNKKVLFHGSNNPHIQTFEPRVQTLFDGKIDKAVFATKDPIWSTFFAVLNKKSLIGSIRNGSLTANRKQKYHFYSLTKQTFNNKPWTNGTVYLVPEQSFTQISNGSFQFDEWICRETVMPLVKMEVEPEDFYFINQVSTHRESESIIKSWFLYKWRLPINRKQNVD